MKNKSIFITGASGFIGKILLSRILEEDPAKIFVLVRNKNGEDSFQRMKKIISDSPCFSHIKSKYKEKFDMFIEDHIHVVEGDISKKNLGISEKDISEIIRNIEYVINIGASVSWKENILEMINSNLNSAIYAMEIAQKAKAKHFIHVSTFLSLTPLELIYQKKFFGDTNFDWEKYINKIQAMNKEEINEETKFIKNNFGTTYAFVKAGADLLIKEKCGNLSTTIIVTPGLGPSLYHPSPGYIDNVTGYTGNYLYLGLSKSLAYQVDKKVLNYEMPVDIFSNYIYHINRQYAGRNQFNRLFISYDSDMTIYDSMIIAMNYFKSKPVPNVKLIEPIIVDTTQELNKYLESLKNTSEYDEKMIQKTRYFNDLYRTLNCQAPSFYEVSDSKLEIIKNLNKEDLKSYPLWDEGFSRREYVELCCEGLKKFYFNS